MVDKPVGVAIVTVEEQMRGWLAAIAKERQSRRQIGPYRELTQLFEFFNEFLIVSFNDAAADYFDQFGSISIGAMDKKSPAIVLANNALLLTANRRHFELIPGLRFKNWTDATLAP